MEWFHFSDFHIGKPNEPQSIALGALIDAVKIASTELKKVDAVFITGDIAYSGQYTEYERFCNEFLFPLKKIPQFSDSPVFAVPGNHDIDCDAVLPTEWHSIGHRNRQLFFIESDEGLRVRSSRVPVFKAYSEFVKAASIISPDPAKEITLFTSNPDYPFDILSTNTAFFSDRDKNSTGETTPSPIDSLRQILRKRVEQKPVVILAHHPLSCIIKAHQSPLSTFLKENKAVLFHGHEHYPSVSFNRDGSIKTLGFGACYLSSQQDHTAPPYLNAFTYCRLEEELYIRCFAWESSIGQWLDNTTVLLSECMPDNNLDANKLCRVMFPSFSNLSDRVGSIVIMRDVQRVAPKPTKIIPIETPNEVSCSRLSLASNNLRALNQKGIAFMHPATHEDGKLQIIKEETNGTRHLVLFIFAVNHVLSSKEVEAINTKLDTEGFFSVTVISVGKISMDASAMYLRLQARKPIEVLTSDTLTAESNRLLSDAQKLHLSKLDAAQQSACLLLGQEDLYLLIINENELQMTFYIIKSDGTRLLPTDSIIARLRKGDPGFSVMPYAGENISSPTKEDTFDEQNYLIKCHKEYNVMKYAALANIGIRFSELPLEQLYVNATASESSENLAKRHEDFVDDHLASYPISEELKEHIHQQLLSSFRNNERQETSHARDFCQRYSAVLITGDPGSGKTCFVKTEILAYCKKALNKQEALKEVAGIDWYSSHIPVMVPLSEVVAEKDFEDKGLIAIASRLLERRALYFPGDAVHRLTLLGKIAFFFDGLDEVVSIEKRAQIVKLINELVIECLPKGNRIIVTSRPAAVQVVNLLPALHKLELQGFTESEIRTLAHKLLTLKIAATQTDIVIGEDSLNDKDHIVINQLLNDCNKNPGISRMAQNPLLLTLLIMIYVNSGAPSAKRHRIYEEAIKTLASVRGREAGHQPISVQDLRERLGAIALSVYKKESGLLPFRSEVSVIVKAAMQRQLCENVSIEEANSFIQRVAESTGLIALEARLGDDANAVVTFMHHSFLEYFAAIGLSRELQDLDVSAFVQEPRWREILTLLAGIIGESDDVATIIKRFLAAGYSEHDVDAKLLLFAMDCALECEVPSEAAQRLISNGIKDCLMKGSGKLDPWVRSEIGQRLLLVLGVCGGAEFDSMFSELMLHRDESVCAAAIDVAGHAYITYEATKVQYAFEQACLRSDDVVMSAICSSASRSHAFRTEKSITVIASCLSKSRRTRNAAYDALSKIPSLASKHWGEIINGIDDKDPRTSRLACVAAMNAGLNFNILSLNATRKDILLHSINNISILSGPEEYPHLQIKKDTLNRLLLSQNLRDRILGIRLLPMVEGEERYVYGKLMDYTRDTMALREELVSALTALRWNNSVLDLITPDDLRIITEKLKNGTADLRIAAVRLLGCFGTDPTAVEALLSEKFEYLDIDDYCERIYALARVKLEVDQVRELFFREINIYLGKKMNKENRRRIKTLLDSARRLGENAPSQLVKKIRDLATDYRIHVSIKKKALLCFPAIAIPSQQTVESIISLFKNPPIGMDYELVQVPSILAKKCRSSVDYVISSVSSLSELRKNLLISHAAYSKRQITDQNEYYISELRNGINDITQILVAFKDFIDNTTHLTEQ